MRNIIFRDDQESRGFFIEPVDDAGTALATYIRQILKVKKEGICDSPTPGSGPGMDHQSCRLFNDRQILVFEMNLERDLLRTDWRRLDHPEIHFDGFSASDAVSGFIDASIDPDRA